jgi:hypothetical protein
MSARRPKPRKPRRYLLLIGIVRPSIAHACENWRDTTLPPASSDGLLEPTRRRPVFAFHTTTMNIHLGLTPLISLVAGILILVMPRLLNFIIAIYLIAIGLVGLFGANMHFR